MGVQDCRGTPVCKSHGGVCHSQQLFFKMGRLSPRDKGSVKDLPNIAFSNTLDTMSLVGQSACKFHHVKLSNISKLFYRENFNQWSKNTSAYICFLFAFL